MFFHSRKRVELGTGIVLLLATASATALMFTPPEHLVRQALAATRDAVDRRRAGEGGCHQGPSAYFAGVAKKLAAEAGIDLGLKDRGEESGAVREGTPEARKARKEAPAGARESSGVDGAPMSPEKAREALRELSARLSEPSG